MLTPEREKEIRDKTKDWGHPDYGTYLFAHEFIPELLAEIDRLRAEKEIHRDNLIKDMERQLWSATEKLNLALEALKTRDVLIKILDEMNGK